MGMLCPSALVLVTIVAFAVSVETDLNDSTTHTTSRQHINPTTWKEPRPEYHANKPFKKKYCATSENASAVLETIMDSSKYNIHSIPKFENGKPLEIKLAVTVFVFRDIKEVDMTYIVDFFLRTEWVDKRLRNDLNCTLTMTMGRKHPAEIIWVPDTIIENSVTSYLHEVLTNNHKIDISPEGEIFWSTRVTVNAMCPMDLVKYPRDKQTCPVVFLSYTHTTDLVNYVWNERNPLTVMDTSSSQFDVTSYDRKSYRLNYAAGEYSILEATFVFERRLGYYLIQVYIPCIFLVVLAGLSFWVDVKATPARVALSLTTLLTITTIWSATNSNMPPVSYVKAVDIYFLTSFGFVLTTLLEYIVVLNYNNLRGAIKERLCVSKKGYKIKEGESACIKQERQQKRHQVFSRERDENCGFQNMHFANGLFALKDQFYQDRDKTESKSEIPGKYENSTSNIDKITRIIYPTAYIVFNIVYWYELTEN